jgi:hypothetical protein
MCASPRACPGHLNNRNAARGGPDEPGHDGYETGHDGYETVGDDYETGRDGYEPERDEYDAAAKPSIPA